MLITTRCIREGTKAPMMILVSRCYKNPLLLGEVTQVYRASHRGECMNNLQKSLIEMLPEEKKNINTSIHQNDHDIRDACMDIGYNQAISEMKEKFGIVEVDEVEVLDIMCSTKFYDSETHSYPSAKAISTNITLNLKD